MTSGERGTEGAIYVEFLLAFMPLFVLFLGIVQLFDLDVTWIIANHAAQLAARTAVVVLPDDPSYYDGAEVNHPTGKRRDAIRSAAMQALKAARSATEVRLTFPESAGGGGDKTALQRDDLVRVHLDVRFQCRVPLVSKMVCPNGPRVLATEAAMPLQGAEFTYP
jgi:hypothetical protein